MSPNSVHRFLIAYDIADDPRHNRVEKTLESYGDRIQYSVFLVDATPAKLLRLRAALHRRMDPDRDCALICDLGPLSHGGQRRMEFIGHPPVYTGEGPLIL